MTTTQQPYIIMTRVDNRLVHGQVGVTWTKTLGANLLLVADDETVYNVLSQKLMTSIAHSSGADIRFFTIEHTAEIIFDAAINQKIYLIVANLHNARLLVEKNVPIKEINIGNMHYAKGKRMISKKVYIDDQDLDDLSYLLEKNIKISIQDYPGDMSTKIRSVEDLK